MKYAYYSNEWKKWSRKKKQFYSREMCITGGQFYVYVMVTMNIRENWYSRLSPRSFPFQTFTFAQVHYRDYGFFFAYAFPNVRYDSIAYAHSKYDWLLSSV